MFIIEQFRIFLWGTIVCSSEYGKHCESLQHADADECDWLNEARRHGWEWQPPLHYLQDVKR